MIQVSEQQYTQIMPVIISNKDNSNKYFSVIEMPVVIHSSNENDIQTNKYPILTSNRGGGTIVAFKGDIDIFYYENNLQGYPIEIMKLIQLLYNKGYYVKMDNNDVMLENHKVASYITDNGYIAIHISMSVDLDIIKEVCGKPMLKIPKGLNDYGITREEIYKIFQD